MNTNSKFLMTTAAPVAVHQCEVISVIAEELFACFTLGYGYALGVIMESTIDERDVTAPATNEALSRADVCWADYDDSGKVSVTEPLVIDHIAEAALTSVKSWAGDVNAFYNSELLKAMVYKLCNDWFQIGTMVRPDTVTNFYNDYSVAMDEAIQANKNVDRSSS